MTIWLILLFYPLQSNGCAFLEDISRYGNKSRFQEIQEGLLTNAKVYIHVTIWIKVCHSDSDVFTILYT